MSRFYDFDQDGNFFIDHEDDNTMTLDDDAQRTVVRLLIHHHHPFSLEGSLVGDTCLWEIQTGSTVTECKDEKIDRINPNDFGPTFAYCPFCRRPLSVFDPCSNEE